MADMNVVAATAATRGSGGLGSGNGLARLYGSGAGEIVGSTLEGAATAVLESLSPPRLEAFTSRIAAVTQTTPGQASSLEEDEEHDQIEHNSNLRPREKVKESMHGNGG